MISIGNTVGKPFGLIRQILGKNGQNLKDPRGLWTTIEPIFHPGFDISVISTFKDWPTALISDKLYGNGLLEFELKDGSRIITRNRTSDRFVILEVWYYNCYTPPGFEIEKQDIVVDIGAHIGCFSIYAANQAGKGKVFSIEPTKENFEMLVRNVSMNKKQNIVSINKAVSNQKGQRKLFLSKANTGGHSFYEEFDKSAPRGERESTMVDTISLSDLFEEYGIERIDFLKIDCEGAEYDILYGSADKAIEKVQKISMEYHDLDDRNRNAKALSEFLAHKGFKVSIVPDTGKGSYIFASR